jgi:hypothetical protein
MTTPAQTLPDDLPILTEVVEEGLPLLTEVIPAPENAAQPENVAEDKSMLSKADISRLMTQIEGRIAEKLEARLQTLQQAAIAEVLSEIRAELPQWLRETPPDEHS